MFGHIGHAAALAFRAGNAAILRCGSDCLQSSLAIAALIAEALAEAGLPADAVQLVDTPDREAVGLPVPDRGAGRRADRLVAVAGQAPEIAGEVVEVNDAVIDDPASVNGNAFDAWLDDPTEDPP